MYKVKEKLGMDRGCDFKYIFIMFIKVLHLKKKNLCPVAFIRQKKKKEDMTSFLQSGFGNL